MFLLHKLSSSCAHVAKVADAAHATVAEIVSQLNVVV